MEHAIAPPELRAPATEPWLARIAATPPWSPWRLSLAIAVALGVLFLAIELASGRFAVLLDPAATRETLGARVDFRIALVLILLVAFLPGAFAFGTRGARRAIDELLPALDAPPHERAALRDGAGRFDAAALRRIGWLGIAIAFVIPFVTDRHAGVWWLWRYSPEPIAQRFLLLAVGWYTTRLLYAVAVESRRLSRAGECVRVDLLDLRAFAPLTRQSLRHALAILGMLSILALMLFDWDKPGLVPVVAINGVLVALVAVVALLLPLVGARRAIQAAKRAELDWCEAALRASRDALARGTTPVRPLAELLAWRSFVLAVHEWPLDAPTLRRFFLYLAIPIGSWLGGALVDRALDTVLH
jgi:hypothetical protein